MSGSSVAGGTADVQSALWGMRPREWCEMEAQVRPVYDAVLERLAVGHGTELLDVGCGAGLAARLAAQPGAVVSGLDATPELLAIAAERAPTAKFTRGDLETLPGGDVSRRARLTHATATAWRARTIRALGSGCA